MRRLLVLATLAVVFGCDYYNEKNPPDPSTITPATVSWSRVSAEFFGPRCAICHGNGGANFNSSDYGSVVAQYARIEQEVFERKRMPPDSPLTAYEQALLSTWIDNGMPYEASQ
jgi:mono/diheme cytochrome c family protein